MRERERETKSESEKRVRKREKSERERKRVPPTTDDLKLAKPVGGASRTSAMSAAILVRSSSKVVHSR